MRIPMLSLILLVAAVAAEPVPADPPAPQPAQPARAMILSGSPIGRTVATDIGDAALIARLIAAIGERLSPGAPPSEAMPTLRVKLLDRQSNRLAMYTFFDGTLDRVRLDAPGREPVEIVIADVAVLRKVLSEAGVELGKPEGTEAEPEPASPETGSEADRKRTEADD